MSPSDTRARFKRRLSLPDLTILAAVYAVDFGMLAGGSPGLFLVGSWAFFVINVAVILLYAPRGWEAPMLVLLVVFCLAAVVLPAPIGTPQAGSASLNRS